MSDKWQEEAARVLPCNPDCREIGGTFKRHTAGCVYIHRPAVAAALAAAEAKGAEEIEQWREGVLSIIDALGATRPQIISFDAICDFVAQLRAERDAANKRLIYLESALRRNGNMYWLGGEYRRGPFNDAIDRAIAAEIAKRQAK